MPIYEYECSKCCHSFEKKQRFEEEPIAICPKCKSKSHRVIHSVPVIFKGSGFYATDSRRTESTEKEKTKEPALNKKGD
jgi:putative FmdB family regulatory protein